MSCSVSCMDSSACNYNVDATEDDSSCEYAAEGFDCDGNCLDVHCNNGLSVF